MFNKEFCTVFIRVVQGCNLNCDFCVTLGNKPPVKIAKLSDISLFLESIHQNVNPDKLAVYLHGGETFLAGLDMLKNTCNIVRQIFGNRAVIIPQTNLVYDFNEDLINFVKEYCDGLGVSWDEKVRFQNKKQEAQFFCNLKQCIDSGLDVAMAIVTQKHLLDRDPIEVVKQFDGCKSIDFEHLTSFNKTTEALKISNQDWSDWFIRIVEYYKDNETTWSLPIIDLFVMSLENGELFNGKVNCDPTSTFTMNMDGTVGLCPDTTFLKPISTVSEMSRHWHGFEKKALNTIIGRKYSMAEQCLSCEHYLVCGGNMEPELFSNDNECPLSKASISLCLENLDIFKKKFMCAKSNLPEFK